MRLREWLALLLLSLAACVSPKGGAVPDLTAGDASPDEPAGADVAGDEPISADAGAPDAAAPDGPAETTSVGGAGGTDASPDSASSSCADNQSVDHCGPLCEKCPVPAGATPTCNGGSCDFTCGAQKKCPATALCVPAGGCCTSSDCPPRAGGQTGTCDSGTHLCNYDCPANTQACTAGGATACIAATGCCRDSDCPGTCQSCSASHTCGAATGRDDPNGRCPGTCDAAGACKSKRGQTCTTTSGGCIAGSPCSPDGTCCDQACTGSCLACDLPGALGTCTPVTTGAPHGPRPACAGAGTSCGGSCAGKADGTCAYPTGACGAPSCLVDGQGNATLTPAGACDDNGQCAPSAPHACPGGLTCASASACKGSCGGSGDCTAGSYCAGGTCATKKATGLACGAAGECATGACVDGVCCGTACSLAAAGMCMGCSTAATGMPNGTCAPRNGSATRACPAISPTACVNTQTDVNNCNGCGTVCSSGGLPAGAIPACLYGACDAVCSTPGDHLCRDTSGIRTCVSTVYDFEGGNDANWVSSDDAQSGPSTTQHHSGSYSYAVYSPNGGNVPIYALPFLCNSVPNNVGMDLRGRTVSAWIYVANSTAGFPNTKCYLSGSSPFGPSATQASPPAGNWFQLSGTFSNTDTNGSFNIRCDLPPTWMGNMSLWYIDDVRID